MDRLQVEEKRIVQFRTHLRSEERSEATIEKYTRDLRMFLGFLTSTEINKETVIAFKKHLAERYAISSANSMLAAVNAFLRSIERSSLKVKPFKTQRLAFSSREAELTREEYCTLLDTAYRQGKKRLWLLLQTLCATGIRVSELEFITVEAVKQHRATAFCKGKSRLVFLPKKLCRLLLDYSRKQGTLSGSIFITKNGKQMDRSNIWQEMKQLSRIAKISPRKVFPHNLRHLFARTYYREQKDLARLADILGHSSVETTRIYILSTGDEQELQVGNLGLLALDPRNQKTPHNSDYVVKGK